MRAAANQAWWRRRLWIGIGLITYSILASTCGSARVIQPERVGPPGHVFFGYGKDDRVAPEESAYASQAAVVAAVLPPGTLELAGDEYVIPGQGTLRSYVWEEFAYPPCAAPAMRFVDEPILPTRPRACSAIAIASTLVLTARHCVTNLGPENDRLAFVFGFRLGSQLRSRQVHRAIGVRARGTNKNDDWALVDVTPPIDAAHVFAGELHQVSTRTNAAAIGHPNYLGLLVSPGWIEPVSHGSRKGLLRGDLDVAEGSSGSPVFDHESRALLGIVVVGDPDNPPVKPPDGQCVRPLWCEIDTPACDGMYMVPVSRFQAPVRTARGL